MRPTAHVIALSIFLALAMAALVPAAPAAALETVTIFAADCTTPQTVFHLGATVCAKVDNVAAGDLNNIWLQWVAPSNTVAFGSPGTTPVTSNGQTFLQALPTSGNGAERGRWTAQTANVSDSAPRVAADFRVPRMSVIGVHRDSPGSVFFFRNTNTTGFSEGTIPFGLPGDIGLVGDWDGDGVFTPGVYRPSDGTFYLANSPVGANADLVIPFSPVGGTPVVGDWDGDGITTIGLYKDDVFHLRNSNTPGPADLTFPYGLVGDTPVVGDWDGDGITTIGTYRDGVFYLRNSNTSGDADLTFAYGLPGDIPIAGNWTAVDGKSTIGTYRSSEGVFYLRNTNDTGLANLTIVFGIPGDQPAITMANEAPVLTAGGTLNYAPNQAATAIDTTITVTDMDSATLVGASVQITGNCAAGEDVLSFADQNGITGTAGSCSMTLSGHSSRANYIAALQSVAYNNTSGTPSALARSVTWQVDDGAVVNNLSNTATSTINVTAKQNQTISFTSSAPAGAMVGGPTYNVTATATSGLTVTFAIDASASTVCSIAGSTVSFIGVGTCVINANQAGDATFNAAPQVQQSFAVGRGSRRRSVSPRWRRPTRRWVGPPTSVSATATSGLAVTFTIDGSAASVCSIAGSTVSFVGAGTCVINANQAGDDTYNPAPQVQQSFAVQEQPDDQFHVVGAGQRDGGRPDLQRDGDRDVGAGGDLHDRRVGGQRVLDRRLDGLLRSNAGTCVINANQAGNATFNPAPQVQQSFSVQKAQTIAFTSVAPNPALFQGPTYNVTATATSGLAVTFTIDVSASTVCSIAGSTVSFIGTGICVINANQGGNAEFYPAPQAQQSFAVVPNAVNDPYNALGNVLVDSSNGLNTPFSVADNDVFPAGTTISAFTATSTPGGGTVTMTTSGANLGRFTYNPPVGFTGTDTFTYTLSSNGQTRTATVTFTVSGKVWFINNNAGACSSNCNGRLTNPFVNTSNFQTDNTGAALKPSANDAIFVYGGGGNYSGSITLLNGQRLVGQGAAGTLASLGNVTVRNGQALPNTGGSSPVLTSGGVVLTVGSGNFVHGLTLGNGTTALSGSGFGTLTANDNVVIDTNGQGLALTNGTFNATLNSVTSTGGTNRISLTNIAGTVTMNGGALSGASGRAIDISGAPGTGNITYAGTISNSGTGIQVANKSGGTVTFSGGTKTLNTGANAAVTLSSNTGATINFTNGGLAITTAAGTGFSATGGGTVTVQGTGNAINSTSGTALNIANTAIGTNHVTFQSISSGTGSNSSPTGIIADSTGSSGGLHVTGTGSAGSGGTIQHKTGADGSNTTGVGIYLNSTSHVQLAWMQLNDFQNFAIKGSQVTNFRLTDSKITGLNGTNVASPFSEGSVSFIGTPTTGFGLTGSVAILDTEITGGRQRNVSIDNATGTMNLNFLRNNVHHTQPSPNGDDGFAIEVDTSAVMFANVSNNTFTAHGGDHFNLSLVNNANADLTFKNNDMQGGFAGALGQGVFILGASYNGTFKYDISNNGTDADPFTGNIQGGAIFVNKGSGTGTFSGQITNNVIGNPAIVGLG